jgi:hypothetical protein
MFQARFIFKTSAGVVITTAEGYYWPLTSEYQGKEVVDTEVKNTSFFLVPFNLRGKVTQGSDHVWIGTTDFLVVGLKEFPNHTEVIGLKQAAIVSPTVDSQLVSEWRFSSQSGIGDDAQGRNPLTNVNGVTYSSDSAPNTNPTDGSCLFVAASSERLEISHANQQRLNVTGSFTGFFRLKLASLPSGTNYTLVSKHGASNGTRGYNIRIDSSSVKLECALSNDGTAETKAIGGTALSSNTWYSVGVVYNGTDIRIYLNGVLDSNGSNNPKTYSAGIYNNSEKFCLGSNSDASRFLDGYLDNAKFYDAALTSSEILNLHNTDSR